MYIVGVYKFADIPSSRIPNIYDPESRRLFPNPEESCFPLVKNSTIVRVIPSSEQKKSADAALSFIFICIYMYICMTQGPIPKDRTPIPNPISNDSNRNLLCILL